MSRASDYAAQVSQILQNKANAIAQGKLASGQILGNTIATLGQVIPQQVQQAMQRSAQQRQEQQIQAIFRKYPNDLGAAINEILPINPELGQKLAKQQLDAEKFKLEYQTTRDRAEQAQREMVMRRLGAANSQDEWEQALLDLHTAGVQHPYATPTWTPELRDTILRSQMSPEKQYDVLHPPVKPKGGQWIDTIGPDGKPGKKYVEDEPGAFVEAPPKDPSAGKKYEVTVPGPGGRPVKKLFTEEELAAGVPEDRAPVSAGPQAPVRVETVEGGKRVIKYLRPDQVMGQTFESPSGGPTLASGQQRKILNYYNRMKDGLETIDNIEPAIAAQGTVRQVQGQMLPSFAQSSTQQQYRQAQRAFTEARLRKESGAAIPPHEYENDAKTYFFQPGDSEEVTAQKKAKRDALLESTAFEAGPAFEEFYGQPFQRGSVTPGVKTMTRAQLKAIAAKNKVSEQEAEKQAKAQGYTVQ